MIAVDTNVVVRYLKGDDVEQSPRARDLIASNEVLVSLTVLLETEWVLRSAYGYDRQRIAAALKLLVLEDQVRVEAPDRVARALTWLAAGLDFADALHLAGADACEALVTFDWSLARRAAGIAPTPVTLA